MLEGPWKIVYYIVFIIIIFDIWISWVVLFYTYNCPDAFLNSVKYFLLVDNIKCCLFLRSKLIFFKSIDST